VDEFSRTDHATDDNMAHAHSMLDTYGYIYSDYVTPISFPLQEWLRNTPQYVLRYTYIACIVCRTFLPPLTLCNTSSFLTLSVQLIFSTLQQLRISKFCRYFYSIFRSDCNFLFPSYSYFKRRPCAALRSLQVVVATSIALFHQTTPSHALFVFSRQPSSCLHFNILYYP